MSNNYFKFKQFIVYQDRCAMKVTTDACLFGAWVSSDFQHSKWEIKTVLDAGTGTGILSLLIAQKNPLVDIDAIEIDQATYKQAMENIEASPFAGRIRAIHADLKAFSFAKKYDVIISNPPFYERELISANQRKNVAHHHSGLLLGELFLMITAHLSTKGMFYILIPFKRNEEIRRILLKQNLFVSDLVFLRQSARENYFRVMIKGKLKQENRQETVINEISIFNDRQEYTSEFRELLKDYYLNL